MSDQSAVVGSNYHTMLSANGYYSPEFSRQKHNNTVISSNPKTSSRMRILSGINNSKWNKIWITLHRVVNINTVSLGCSVSSLTCIGARKKTQRTKSPCGWWMLWEHCPRKAIKQERESRGRKKSKENPQTLTPLSIDGHWFASSVGTNAPPNHQRCGLGGLHDFQKEFQISIHLATEQFSTLPQSISN